jgi:hypothetical protein
MEPLCRTGSCTSAAGSAPKLLRDAFSGRFRKIEGLLKGNVISGLPFSHRKQPDSISLIDSDGEILYESASTTRLFGYQPEDCVWPELPGADTS